MKIYIIILHYGEIENTFDCLRSVELLYSRGINIKIVLINNSKFKIQKSKLKLKIQNFDLINNQKNLGFAGGVNVGIREALKDKQTEYILILNNDTKVPANLLLELLNNPSDITAPVIKYKDATGNWRYDFGGKINWLWGKTFHLENESGIMNQELRNQKIDYISGCAMCVKRKVFEKIGLFDERFFLYFEDADFCTRAKRNGYNITVNPDVVIFHQLSGGLSKKNLVVKYNLLKSNYTFICNYLGLKIPLGLIYLILFFFKLLLK